MSCIICNHEIKEYEPENFIAIEENGTVKEYLVCSSCIEYDDVHEWLMDILGMKDKKCVSSQ